MAVAIHINYDTKVISHVTGVANDVLCISKDSPSSVNDTDAVETGIVFSDEGGSADQLKTYLTAVLALMVAASDNADYRYLAQQYTVGEHRGDAVAFYKSALGTSHWTLKKLMHANVQEPRVGNYSIEFNLDGDYDEAGTAAKTFYDALLTKKNLL
jgi:hypothetical protein